MRPSKTEFIESLAERTKARVGMLHFVERPDGWKCLDVNLMAPTLAQLRAVTVAAINGLGAWVVLPHAPIEEWDAIWDHPPVAIRGMKEFRTLAGFGGPVSYVIVRVDA